MIQFLGVVAWVKNQNLVIAQTQSVLNEGRSRNMDDVQNVVDIFRSVF